LKVELKENIIERGINKCVYEGDENSDIFLGCGRLREISSLR
jgi:hypothetical protein